MCFDTTASNTGQRKGACILIEQKLDKSLLHLACRHHICEIVLEAVFTNRLVGVSSGPDILVFKRFKSAWRSIDKSKYTTSITDAFTAQAVADCKDDIIAFAREMLLSQQPRDEYKELLELVIIFLGSSPSREVPVHFMAPGALHRARWMAKAIYAIKIWIFKEQFRLTKREGLRDLAIFVSCIYLKMWFLAPLPTAAPNNDLITLKKLHDYKNINEGIASVAIRKALSHLWYLGEELVSLAFFDRNVSTETKHKMVAALSDESPDPENVAKKATLTANAIPEKSLEQFVSSNSLRFFDVMGIEREFLITDPEEWHENENYLTAEGIARGIKVVNGH